MVSPEFKKWQAYKSANIKAGHRYGVIAVTTLGAYFSEVYVTELDHTTAYFMDVDTGESNSSGIVWLAEGNRRYEQMISSLDELELI